MHLWKVIGLAGVAGLTAAAGAIAVRQKRAWVETPPDELRRRLHQRLADAENQPK